MLLSSLVRISRSKRSITYACCLKVNNTINYSAFHKHKYVGKYLVSTWISFWIAVRLYMQVCNSKHFKQYKLSLLFSSKKMIIFWIPSYFQYIQTLVSCFTITAMPTGGGCIALTFSVLRYTAQGLRLLLLAHTYLHPHT